MHNLDIILYSLEIFGVCILLAMLKFPIVDDKEKADREKSDKKFKALVEEFDINHKRITENLENLIEEEKRNFDDYKNNLFKNIPLE